MKIDADKPIPKYLQLKAIIQNYFDTEQYKTDQKIPSENELAARFQISRNTVRQALAELVKEGIIYKKRGMGSFFSGKTREEQRLSYLIGVLTPRVIYYIYPQIIRGIDDVARRKRYNIVLGNSYASYEKELQCLEQLLEKHIDGLLFEPSGGFRHFQDSHVFHILQDLKIPVVFMNWKIDDPNISYVSLDDTEGGFRATAYLAQAGHTRIACLFPDDKIPGMQRYQGYRNALAMYDIPHDSRLEKRFKSLDWDRPECIPAAVRELLDLGNEKPSALFFYNDEGALRAYSTIREAGLKIPHDISMMGFDNSEVAAQSEIPLTSINHPKYKIGKWAAELLFEQIAEREQRISRKILITPTVVARDSVKQLLPPT